MPWSSTSRTISGPLRRRPEPVRRTVGEPGALRVSVEGEPQAEHPGRLLPLRDQRATLGALDGQPAHDGEAVGMPTSGGEGEVVAISLP